MLWAGIAITAVAIVALLFLPAHNDEPLLDDNGGNRAGCIEVAVAGRGRRRTDRRLRPAEPRLSASAHRASTALGPEAILAACREAGVRF